MEEVPDASAPVCLLYPADWSDDDDEGVSGNGKSVVPCTEAPAAPRTPEVPPVGWKPAGQGVEQAVEQAVCAETREECIARLRSELEILQARLARTEQIKRAREERRAAGAWPLDPARPTGKKPRPSSINTSGAASSSQRVANPYVLDVP